MVTVGENIKEKPKTQPFRSRGKTLWNEQNTWRPVWQETAQYMLPARGRFLNDSEDKDENATDGSRKDGKIINGSAVDAVRIIAAGLQGGLTSPSRPWFVFGLEDKALQEFKPVREWLHDVRNRMLRVLGQSNFYGAVHGLYGELAAFGTGAMLIENDQNTIIRCRPYTIGEYALGQDANRRVNALYRKFWMTAGQMASMFKEEQLSQPVLEAIKDDKLDQWFLVWHAIQPRERIQSLKADFRGMSFSSNYWENANSDEEVFLREGGYRGIPFIAPRWEVVAVNTYGDCPGRSAIGDVKMLQKLERKKLKALDKHVDPPMNAPVALRKKGGTIIAGGVNYIDTQQGQAGFTPAYQTNPDIRGVSAETEIVERRIRRFFFNDLFLTLLGADKAMTATEIARRHEEKLIMIGPVVERLQSEMHDPGLDRVYNVMDERGLIPPPPEELEGVAINIQYQGLLAQAQKLVSLQGVERLAGYVGNLAGMKPDVVDKFDADQSVDEYADALGVPAKLIKSDEEVAQERAARAEAQRAAQMAENAESTAHAAKIASETDVKGESALDRMADNQGVT